MKKSALGLVLYVFAILFAITAANGGGGIMGSDGKIVGFAIMSGFAMLSGTLALVFGEDPKEKP